MDAPARLFGPDPDGIVIHAARDPKGSGWALHVSWYRGGELEVERGAPVHYDRLRALELLDVIDAELDRLLDLRSYIS
jgi:hypothetical protein